MTQSCSPNFRERSADAEVTDVDHPKLSGEERRRGGHRCEPPVSDLSDPRAASNVVTVRRCSENGSAWTSGSGGHRQHETAANL